MKTRPSKTKDFSLKFYPHHSLYYKPLPKSQKGLIYNVNLGSWSTCGSSGVIFRCLWSVYRCPSGNVLSRFFIDRILFKVLSDRVLYESSVIECSSGSTVVDSFLGSSMLFLHHVAIFLSNCAPIFLSKKIFLFYFHYILKSN